MKRALDRKLFRRSLLLCVLLLLAGFIAALTLTSVSSGEPRSNSEVVQHQQKPTADKKIATIGKEAVLRLMTLNVAHGRSDGPNQIFQKTRNIRANLGTIAKLLSRVGPDVVALQEADGPSFWRGKFDRVEYLATNAGFE